MRLVAGVDIGNSTTEVCLATINEMNNMRFLSSAMTDTTGTKGTKDNVIGIKLAINKALEKAGKSIDDLSVIRINEATPVIGDTAMETITETIITESTMIGHNPDTPAGIGVGIGIIVDLYMIEGIDKSNEYIVIVDETLSYKEAATAINRAVTDGYKITGAIVQKDEAVLVHNRISNKIPIIDEVKYIEKIPRGMRCAIEVADIGHTIKTLCDPYGIASIFKLTPKETKFVVTIAKSLVGTRSAVVIKTPEGSVDEKIVPAGCITVIGENDEDNIDIDIGADKIMSRVAMINNIQDVYGEQGTNVGEMITSIKNSMASLTNQPIESVKIKDILAVDTTIPLRIDGGLAGEVSMENAVGIAAMVKTGQLPMQKIANELKRELGIFVSVAGVEAVMASIGSLTTPGTQLPLAILDLGGGSTDAAILDNDGTVKSVHLAGAGQLITMLIDSELGLNDSYVAEEIKRYPLAKVESLFHVRMENGETIFYEEPLMPKLFGKVVILDDKGMVPINKSLSMERVMQVRKKAKKKVFVRNAIRALNQIAPNNDLRQIPNVVLVGGSALDFEIPGLISEELSNSKVVSGRGNIRDCEGPRNAVATGLVMSSNG